MIDTEEPKFELLEQIAKNKARIQEILDEGNLLDDDGYPTEDALEAIERWHWDDARGWFKFIEGLWWYSNMLWIECEGGIDQYLNKQLDPKTIRYHVSTGGWSGNESIIRAMQQNDMMWHLNWVQSRRGGHYIFELKDLEFGQE